MEDAPVGGLPARLPGMARFRLRIAVAAAFAVAFAAVVVLHPGTAYGRLVFVDVASFVIPLGTAGACAWRATKESATLRLGWGLLAAGCASWAIGQAAWAAYVLVLDQEAAPSPGIADLGYLGLVPLAGAGLLAFLSGPGLRAHRLRTLLDATIVAASLLFMSWAAVLRDVVGATVHEGVGLGGLVYLAYPTGDILLATLAFLLLARAQRGDRRTMALLGAGALALAVADTMYVVQGLRGLFQDATVVHTGWIVGFELIGLAALRPQNAAAIPTTRPTLAAATLPYWALLLAIGTAIQSQREHGMLEPFLFWTALVVVVLVVVRQFVMLMENLALTRQSEAALGQLRDSELKRTRLVQTVTHDLRNPLSPILLQLNVLGRRELVPEVRSSLAVIQRNVEQIDRLVSDLSDVAKLEDGRITLEPVAVDVAAILRDVHATFAPVAGQSRIAFGLEVPANLPGTADPIRLRQVVVNFVSNAVKFTPEHGTIALRGRLEAGGLVVEVQDSGRGLTPAEQGRLFQPFSQVHARGETKERGTGLGLYISKAIVERHGGQAGVRSEGRGRGSTFWFTLPARADPPASSPASLPPA